MLEQRRQQYLSLLGVDNYVPRRLLVGAAASALLTEEQIGLAVDANSSITAPNNIVQTKFEVGEAASVVGAKENAPTPNPISPLSLLNPDTETEQESTKSEQASVDPEAQKTINASAQSEALNFVLHVWRIRDQLLIIDSRQPGAAYPTDRLLQNILRAMGYPLAQLPASEIIRWPLFVSNKNNSKTIEQQNQDAEQACAMVQAYITAQMTKLPFKALVCMGDNAARFSVNHQSESDAIGKTPWEIPVAITPSLFGMLQEPLLKASAWSALQVLMKEIAS